VFERFQNNIDDARAIFDSIKESFDDDPHFWLQRGSLELEYGELSLAGTYLLAAESLAPDDWMIQTSKGYWTLKRACVSSDPKERDPLWKEGEGILRDVVTTHGGDTYYPYQIIGSQTVAFLRAVRTGKQRQTMIQSAIQIVADGLARFPKNRDLLAVAQRLERVRVGLDG